MVKLEKIAQSVESEIIEALKADAALLRCRDFFITYLRNINLIKVNFQFCSLC